MSEKQENLRRGFRPDPVRLLFIGESPPASERFFYQGDSGLYRAVRDAFCTVDGSISDENFLARFQACGCYLIDLCREPVDGLDARSRRAACLAGEPELSRTIAELQPIMIVTLLRSIEGNVLKAAACARWNGQFLHLPYPGRWIRHREVFTAALVPIITPFLVK